MSDKYYDEVASSKQEVVAKTHDMADQRRKVIAQLSLETGESVLDVGSGNGILARGVSTPPSQWSLCLGACVLGHLSTGATHRLCPEKYIEITTA